MEITPEKRVFELLLRTREKNYANFTAFLSAEETAKIKPVLLGTDCKYEFFGGYTDAERKILGIFPQFYENADFEEYPIKLLKIKGSGFCAFSHRDVLGSLMSLGIKREFLGDIVCVKDENTAFVFVHKSIFEFCLEGLERVARDSVKTSQVSFSDLPDIQKEFKLITDTVLSLRLDGVLCGCLKVSREKAEKLILSGVVSVNHAVNLKKDTKIKCGNLLSVKGEGRFLLSSAVENKKGKLRIEILKYI